MRLKWAFVLLALLSASLFAAELAAVVVQVNSATRDYEGLTQRRRLHSILQICKLGTTSLEHCNVTEEFVL